MNDGVNGIALAVFIVVLAFCVFRFGIRPPYSAHAQPAATSAATAPASMPDRGPAAWASQPISGAPIAVEPRKTIA